jgi:hypothetical protein
LPPQAGSAHRQGPAALPAAAPARRFLAADVDRIRAERATLPAAWSSRVDLPMPGSPPIRIAEPGTSPPPSARSNSASPWCGAPASRRARRAPRTRWAPAGGKIVLGGKDRLRALPRPACSIRRNRRTGPASGGDRLPQAGTDIAAFGLGHGPAYRNDRGTQYALPPGWRAGVLSHMPMPKPAPCAKRNSASRWSAMAGSACRLHARRDQGAVEAGPRQPRFPWRANSGPWAGTEASTCGCWPDRRGHACAAGAADIVAGASAGGINGVFLAQAIHSGQSLDPLTDLWLERADVDVLLDPDARPWSRIAKFWAMPMVWFCSSGRAMWSRPASRPKPAAKCAPSCRA